MYFFTKYISFSNSGFLDGFTDVHSHLLPGVDDGICTMSETLSTLVYLEELGVKRIWFTPHIMDEVPNSTKQLRQRFKEVRNLYRGKIEINLAAEYMLDCLFDERLDRNDLLPLKNNYLLVETSCFNPPINLMGTLSNIRSKGYFPVLAHPERYVYMDMPDYYELKKSGVKLQLNLFSLVEIYGKNVYVKAHRLLKKGLYSMAGCDIHSLPELQRAINIKKLPVKTLPYLKSIEV